jgi:protein ImuB
MSFAAIHIPDFSVEAMVRAEPELREQAVAVVEGTPPLVHVLAVNERAAQAGVEPGMTRLQAEERLAGGAMRQRSAEREAAAHAALLDCACGFSPRVEDTAADTVVLDLAGLERIFGPPPKMARDMARRCSEMGLEANVAVASNPDTAVLAACGFAGVTIIADGREAERLGELSVDVVCGTRAPACADSRTGEGACATPALEILETLERWGVHNLRALAALPEVAVAERLGQDGLRLQKLARGQTRRPLVIADPPLVFEEAVELEFPVALLEPMSFLLNRMLEQLCARLVARALATNELKLRLELDLAADIDNAPRRHGDTEEVDGRWSMADGNTDLTPDQKSQISNHQCSVSPCLRGEDSFFTRTLRFPVPMLDARVFLKLLHLDLQAHPPQAPVTKIWLRAEPAEPRRAQNGLFVPQAPEAERLELTIARIQRVVGQTAKDEKNRRLPIVDCRLINETERNQQSTIDNQQCISEARVGSPEILDTHRPDGFRMTPFTAASVARVSHPETGHTVTAFRVFRPPLPAVVTVREGRPAHIASPERPAMRGEVAWCAGPWLSSGEWWTEQPWSRQEWDVAVRNEEGVALYRVYRDEVVGKWFVEGTYD